MFFLVFVFLEIPSDIAGEDSHKFFDCGSSGDVERKSDSLWELNENRDDLGFEVHDLKVIIVFASFQSKAVMFYYVMILIFGKLLLYLR